MVGIDGAFINLCRSLITFPKVTVHDTSFFNRNGMSHCHTEMISSLDLEHTISRKIWQHERWVCATCSSKFNTPAKDIYLLSCIFYQLIHQRCSSCHLVFNQKQHFIPNLRQDLRKTKQIGQISYKMDRFPKCWKDLVLFKVNCWMHFALLNSGSS